MRWICRRPRSDKVTSPVRCRYQRRLAVALDLLRNLLLEGVIVQDEDQGQEDLEGTHNHKAHNEPERRHKGQEIARAAPALPSPTVRV